MDKLVDPWERLRRATDRGIYAKAGILAGRSAPVEMQEALKQEKKARRTLGLAPEERRYVVRSGSERINQG